MATPPEKSSQEKSDIKKMVMNSKYSTLTEDHTKV